MTQPQRPTFPPAVLDAWKRGDKIEAIKLLRKSTEMGLAEAKTLLDALKHANVAPARERQSPDATTRIAHRPTPDHVYHARPGLSPGQVTPSNESGVGWMLLITAGAVVLYLALN